MCSPKVPKTQTTAEKKPQVFTNKYFTGGPAVMGDRLGRNSLRINLAPASSPASPTTPPATTAPSTPTLPPIPRSIVAPNLPLQGRNDYLRGMQIR